MKEYWIITSFNGSDKQFFFKRNDKEMYMTDRIWSSNPYSCTKFSTENEAIDLLLIARNKFHWGGIFQIEKIYISQ